MWLWTAEPQSWQKAQTIPQTRSTKYTRGEYAFTCQDVNLSTVSMASVSIFRLYLFIIDGEHDIKVAYEQLILKTLKALLTKQTQEMYYSDVYHKSFCFELFSVNEAEPILWVVSSEGHMFHVVRRWQFILVERLLCLALWAVSQQIGRILFSWGTVSILRRDVILLTWNHSTFSSLKFGSWKMTAALLYVSKRHCCLL